MSRVVNWDRLRVWVPQGGPFNDYYHPVTFNDLKSLGTEVWWCEVQTRIDDREWCLRCDSKAHSHSKCGPAILIRERES